MLIIYDDENAYNDVDMITYITPTNDVEQVVVVIVWLVILDFLTKEFDIDLS